MSFVYIISFIVWDVDLYKLQTGLVCELICCPASSSVEASGAINHVSDHQERWGGKNWVIRVIRSQGQTRCAQTAGESVCVCVWVWVCKPDMLPLSKQCVTARLKLAQPVLTSTHLARHNNVWMLCMSDPGHVCVCVCVCVKNQSTLIINSNELQSR